VKTIANAFTARRSSGSEVAELKEQLDQQAAELEEAQRSIADLHNRLDFAERLLAQQRERTGLGPGEK
jgi:DNA repair exonuclease SbcCD ATPase subunit